MSSSDLFTVLAILLAVYALLTDEQRKYYHLKFSKYHWAIIILLFGYIHLLVSFNWWVNHFDWLSSFYRVGWPTSGAYAYILSTFLIGYIIWLLMKAYYAKNKGEELTEFYQQLISKKDYSLLAKLINKYHNSDAQNYFNKRRLVEEKIEKDGVNDIFPWQKQRDKIEKITTQLVTGKKVVYAGVAYNSAITNEIFIAEAANDFPHLFCPWIENLNTQELSNPEFVNSYLRSLIKNKNSILFREIRNNQNYSSYRSERYRIEKKRPILYALFNDINVSIHNEVWRSIGEETIYELVNESNQPTSTLRLSEKEQDTYNDTIWSFRITNAIWFFDIMIREAIGQDKNNHMWMYYYQYFIRELIKNMKEGVDNSITRNHDLVELIISKNLDWIDVCLNTDKTQLLDTIIKCYGYCIHEIIVSEKISNSDKSDLAGRLFNKIIRVSPYDNQNEDRTEVITLLMDFMLDVYIRPPYSYKKENKIQYRRIVLDFWNKRDLPALYFKDRLDHFERDVINQL